MTLTYNQKIMDEIREEHKKWQKKLDEIFRASPERLARFSTVSDKEIKNLYTPEDVGKEHFEKDLGFPGEYPFTRGVSPPCIGAGYGPCACSPVLAQPRTRTTGFIIWSRKARQGSQPPLICRP